MAKAKLTVAQRLARLEAAEEIRRMKHKYCWYCDNGYDPDGIISLFTKNGVWDGGPFGRHVGHKEIHAFFSGVSSQIVFAAHLVQNELIDVAADCRSAKGEWWLIMPCTVRTDDGTAEARWLCGYYREKYVNERGKWKFKELTLDLKFFEPHRKGWAGG
jgi:hypothetical protein